MPSEPMPLDVLCVGHAAYDLIFSVARHPEADEKIVAGQFLGCGGGPAANAAVCISRLGFKAAFAGYLGNDLYGDKHQQELIENAVYTGLIVRGQSPTPLSSIIVKPDGKRALINFKGATKTLGAQAINFSMVTPKVVLFDGHEPHLSLQLLARLQHKDIPTVLDAGSLHEGTSVLLKHIDYLVCSEKFARQYAGDVQTALTQLAEIAPAAVITLGGKGLIWKRGDCRGSLPALQVNAVDTTGAGDAFHGAFAAAVSAKMDWLPVLRYASAAAALCCTKTGARPGLPWQQEHQRFLTQAL